jgi:hypothetical protein
LSIEDNGYRRLPVEHLAEEHRVVLGLCDRGVINDDVLLRIPRELDLEEIQFAHE